MAEIVVVGAGVVGMGLGMLLARDGHTVTLVERDAQEAPADPEEAWAAWERRGVNQFRLAHLFLPRYRHIIDAELPQLASALERDGALRLNQLLEIPESIRGAIREGDDRFELLTGRRAVVERAVASVAAQTPGLAIRRGTTVVGLLTGTQVLAGTPHVVGLRTDVGEEMVADLVIDCSGRRSALGSWLADIGARPMKEELEDSGFIYLGRHFRSRDGGLPPALGGSLQPYGSISVLTLPADNDTWSVTLVAQSGDKALLGLRDVERWETVVRALPTVAHWLDGDVIEDRVVTMSKIEDRHRDFRPGGVPVATGVLPVADAWACTNPSVGRGASIGMMHAQALRDCLRETSPDRPDELSESFAVATEAACEPWYRSTLAFDRHRLNEMAARARGESYHPGTPDYEATQALQAAVTEDADCLRGFLDIAGVLETPEQVIARPGLLKKVIKLGADWRDRTALGPDRSELVKLASA